ncbi:MAG: hypothetical protein Ta2D_01650 [Rickettsiales bacterium]|nr:MAG: hypothetical protein Ta2D_01650 [Rickettsiales bacterium]
MEKQYQVLARKYRPLTFSELVGQDALVRTLENQIKLNKIHHAFILTGIRGIGKTTTARIIAKALNCSANSHPTITPCLECEHCKAIANSNDPDVIEFDAASNTGVEDARKIIDSTQYAPISSRYKIFIIDEVHMLSKSAFNALLKTLEEPPPYIKFIFATTEIKKVPVTILSRCQKFNLRRLNFDETKNFIKGLCSKENFEIEDGASDILANFAEGSARDATSLLDRALSYNEYKTLLTEYAVSNLLGLSGKKAIYDLFSLLLEGKTNEVLEQFEQIYTDNVDANTILQELLEVNYNIILAKNLTKFFEITKIPSDQLDIINKPVPPILKGMLYLFVMNCGTKHTTHK